MSLAFFCIRMFFHSLTRLSRVSPMVLCLGTFSHLPPEHAFIAHIHICGTLNQRTGRVLFIKSFPSFSGHVNWVVFIPLNLSTFFRLSLSIRLSLLFLFLHSLRFSLFLTFLLALATIITHCILLCFFPFPTFCCCSEKRLIEELADVKNKKPRIKEQFSDLKRDLGTLRYVMMYYPLIGVRFQCYVWSMIIQGL